MVYTLTDKLNMNEDPIIEIRGKKVTVKSDAETVLNLLSILREEGEMKATLSALEFLFSEKDQKTIRGLKLNFTDYVKLLETAVSLALGEDPDEEEKGE